MNSTSFGVDNYSSGAYYDPTYGSGVSSITTPPPPTTTTTTG
jgi:hypothetical protein